MKLKLKCFCLENILPSEGLGPIYVTSKRRIFNLFIFLSCLKKALTIGMIGILLIYDFDSWKS